MSVLKFNEWQDLNGDKVYTAAEMNALPAGIVGGSGVGWDTVSSNTAITTSPLTLLSVTFTAQASRLYQVDFYGYFYNASAALIFRASIKVGGTVKQLADASVSGAGEVASISTTAILNLGAGSKTVTVDVQTLTGTGGVAAAAATYGPWLVVKDVGPA